MQHPDKDDGYVNMKVKCSKQNEHFKSIPNQQFSSRVKDHGKTLTCEKHPQYEHAKQNDRTCDDPLVVCSFVAQGPELLLGVQRMQYVFRIVEVTATCVWRGYRPWNAVHPRSQKVPAKICKHVKPHGTQYATTRPKLGARLPQRKSQAKLKHVCQVGKEPTRMEWNPSWSLPPWNAMCWKGVNPHGAHHAPISKTNRSV